MEFVGGCLVESLQFNVSNLSCHFLYFADFLNELLKSRRKKSGKSKAKINDFDISDDEGKHSKTKRVSFLKTQRISSPTEDTAASESRENEPPDSSKDRHNDYNSQHSMNVSEDNVQSKTSDAESTDPQRELTRESTSQSLSYQTSGETLQDMPLPLPSDTPAPEEKSDCALEERSESPQLSAADGLFTQFHAKISTGTLYATY